jgi:hypothetical protein
VVVAAAVCILSHTKQPQQHTTRIYCVIGRSKCTNVMAVTRQAGDNLYSAVFSEEQSAYDVSNQQYCDHDDVIETIRD